MIYIFKNKRFTTRGVAEEVPLLLQMIMWNLIDDMPPLKDYLQVFECTVFGGKQKITHIQEEPEYKKEYLIQTDAPFFIGKIFVIDDETYSTK